MVHKISPCYLSNLCADNTTGTYLLRNSRNIRIPFCKTESYKKSFVPSTISMWNNLNILIRSCISYNVFKTSLRKAQFSVKQNKALSMGHGTSWVHLTRMRMGMSGLRSHLYGVNIIDSPICTLCNSTPETVHHFFMSCPALHECRALFNDKVDILLADNNQLPVDNAKKRLSIIMQGSEQFSNSLNYDILKLACEFITNSKRF